MRASFAQLAKIDIDNHFWDCSIVVAIFWLLLIIMVDMKVFQKKDNEFNSEGDIVGSYLAVIQETLTKGMMLLGILMSGGLLAPVKIPQNVPRWIFPVVTAIGMVLPRFAIGVYQVPRDFYNMNNYQKDFLQLSQ
jgi:hypothetical protein